MGGASTAARAAATNALSAHWPSGAASSVGDQGVRTAEVRGQILHLGQPVVHRQHGLLVIDVDARPEREVHDDEGIQQAQAWLFRNFKQEVSLTALAARVA
jgi:hypothetical protein